MSRNVTNSLTFYSFEFHWGKAFMQENKLSCKTFDTLTYNRIIRFYSLYDHHRLRLQENYLYCHLLLPNTQCRETIAILFAAAASFTTRWASFHPFLLWGSLCDIRRTPSGMCLCVHENAWVLLKEQKWKNRVIQHFLMGVLSPLIFQLGVYCAGKITALHFRATLIIL